MARCILFFLLVLAVSARNFKGRVKRQSVLNKEQLWPNGIIRYRYVFPFTSVEKKSIREAMHEWEVFTCVKFQEEPASSTAHVAKIQRNSENCLSSTGVDYADQMINLGVDCTRMDVVLHEVGHTIGLIHEQERTDRDRYIKIDPSTVQARYIEQFQVAPEQKSFGTPYSYRSIMHYGKDFFNKKGFVAIQALDKKFYDIIGNAEHLSFRDAWIVNKMYNCDRRCPSPDSCPPGTFRGKDCRCWCRNVEYTAVDCLTKKAIDPKRVVHHKGRLMRNRGSGTLLYWSEHEFDWFTSRDRCKAMGGTLVDFKDPRVLPDVERNIEALARANYEPLNKYKAEFLWTGGNDINREGTFQWLDGSMVNMRALSMGRGEPNNGAGLNEDCLAIFPQAGSTFADWDCGKRLRYICNLKSECHDLSPTCAYYSKIGACRLPMFANDCRLTCGGCKPGEAPKPSRKGPIIPPVITPPPKYPFPGYVTPPTYPQPKPDTSINIDTYPQPKPDTSINTDTYPEPDPYTSLGIETYPPVYQYEGTVGVYEY